MKDLSSVRSQLPNSGIREIMELSSTMDDVIHLEVGEPNINTPVHIIEAAYEAMKSGYTRYTSVAGLMSLREKLSQHLHNKYHLSIPPEQIIVTSGGATALAASMQSVADIGDEILIPDPGYPAYEIMLIAQGSIPVRYPLVKENSFIPCISTLKNLVSDRTKAIIINTPSNPLGVVYTERVLQDIVQFALENDLYIISDEVYDGIVFKGQHICAKKFDPDGRIISIFSFSKNYAMTGWRVGYAVASDSICSVMKKILLPWISCASSISQKAAEAAISGSQDFLTEMAMTYMRRRDRVWDILNLNNIKAYKPEGAFYMLIDFQGINIPSHELARRLLEEEKVSVAPGNTFGNLSAKMLRISLATEDSELIEGVQRIVRFVKRYELNMINEKINLGGI